MARMAIPSQRAGSVRVRKVRLYPFAATFKPGHRLTVELSNDEPPAGEHNSLLPPDAFRPLHRKDDVRWLRVLLGARAQNPPCRRAADMRGFWRAGAWSGADEVRQVRNSANDLAVRQDQQDPCRRGRLLGEAGFDRCPDGGKGRLRRRWAAPCTAHELGAALEVAVIAMVAGPGRPGRSARTERLCSRLHGISRYGRGRGDHRLVPSSRRPAGPLTGPRHGALNRRTRPHGGPGDRQGQSKWSPSPS